MRYSIARNGRRGVHLRQLTAAFATATVVTTSACDRLLSVDNPANVPVDALTDPGLMFRIVGRVERHALVEGADRLDESGA